MRILRTARPRTRLPSVGMQEAEILSGWKDIANYLQKGVRTVQRYERELRLPIRRPAGKSTGVVIATKPDLDGWVSARTFPLYSLVDFKPIARRANELKADFLQIDSKVALTFSGMALGASDPEKKERIIQIARRAYDAIMRLRDNVELSDVQRDKLDTNMGRLKSDLQSLGESF